MAQAGTAPSGLAPGAPAQPVAFRITNPKTSAQYIAAVTVAVSSITRTSDGSPASGCTAGDFAVVQPTALNANVSPGSTTYDPSGATLRMIESGQNQDGCQDVTVNLSFTAA